MSQFDALQNINLEIQVLLGNKDFKNSKLRSLLKQAKVSLVRFSWPSTAMRTFRHSPRTTSSKQVLPSPFS